MVRPRGLEPPRDLTPTATSTLRVYRFRHGRVNREMDCYQKALARASDFNLLC